LAILIPSIINLSTLAKNGDCYLRAESSAAQLQSVTD
jgi:hypothetical protein